MATLINQDNLRETMSGKVFKKAIEHFSIERMGNDCLNLISKLKPNDTKGFNIKNYTWKDSIPDKAIQLKVYLKRKLK
ncbi:MAG: hypothetical protein GX259_07680 [Bacteroidales bacterium]|nr:hypothetical protein [Bacteroidales bacterium]